MMTLKQALMRSQGLNEAEAQTIIDEMKQRVEEGEDPEDLLEEEGLEPDYAMDLLC